MNYFKKLFSKDKPSVPAPSQSIPGIEPIVIQAVENLFPLVSHQQTVFQCILELKTSRKGVADPHTLLALLYYSSQDVEKFRKSAWQSHPHFWMDEIQHIFPTMKDAEDWVATLSKPQA